MLFALLPANETLDFTELGWLETVREPLDAVQDVVGTEVCLSTLGMNGADGLHPPFFEHLQSKPPTALAHEFATLSTMRAATGRSLGAH